MTTTSPEPQVETDTVTITIDGKEIQAKKGELLISAAQRAGVFIPRFCYHDRLKPVGMCRMCLVEIEGVRGLPPACTTPVSDGMVVNFQKENVDKAQDGVLEFLLINHPLDCPVCDRGGECPLQDQTLSFGPGESRFVEEKRHWEKPIEISDHVLLDRERCIQCARCTRFADDVAGDPLITFVERGGHTEVNTFPGDPFASHFSGNIVQICPVGALTAKPYRFNARPWDLASAETTCTKCSLNCKGVAQTSRNEMVRFLGVDSEPINQGWLCDNGRYGFDFIDSENRVRSPFVKEDNEKREVNLNEALDIAADKIKSSIENHGRNSVAFLGGAHSSNEDAFEIARLAKGTIGTNYVDSVLNKAIPADLIFTTRRARISDIDNAKAVIVLGVDVKESIPVLYLRLRKAAVENNVPVVNAYVSSNSLSQISKAHIDLVPGDEPHCEKQILEQVNEIISSSQREGKVVVIAGDINNAQSADTFSELVASVLEKTGGFLLPALSQGNVMGALEMGLTPGLLPGRVKERIEGTFTTWTNSPDKVENYGDFGTQAILEKCKSGEIKTLVLFGANPIADFSDQTLALEAFQNCENIIAVDMFENESTEHADVFIACTGANEKNGTTTNIEGRVQRIVQVVAPQGNVYDDWKIANLLSKRLGSLSEVETVEEITNEIARTATSFAHLTTGVLARARDGAIVPIDENKDALVSSQAPLADTPSWEPIASRALSDEDPITELDREEHHPSANVIFAPMISNAVSIKTGHSHHLDQYALRLVFTKSFHSPSTISDNSSALAKVSNERYLEAVRVNPKDIESISKSHDNLVTFQNDMGKVQVRVVPDKSVMRGVALAFDNTDHPLRKLVSASSPVTDIKVEVS